MRALPLPSASLFDRLIEFVRASTMPTAPRRRRLSWLMVRLLGVQMRRASIPAVARVAERLGVDADHVIFGHVHRLGPLRRRRPAPVAGARRATGDRQHRRLGARARDRSRRHAAAPVLARGRRRARRRPRAAGGRAARPPARRRVPRRRTGGPSVRARTTVLVTLASLLLLATTLTAYAAPCRLRRRPVRRACRGRAARPAGERRRGAAGHRRPRAARRARPDRGAAADRRRGRPRRARRRVRGAVPPRRARRPPDGLRGRPRHGAADPHRRRHRGRGGRPARAARPRRAAGPRRRRATASSSCASDCRAWSPAPRAGPTARVGCRGCSPC